MCLILGALGAVYWPGYSVCSVVSIYMPHEGPDLANQNNRKLEVLDRTRGGIHSLVV